MSIHRAEIDATFAEAFRSIDAEVLLTARDRTWLDRAVSAATGNASSSILCDCEAALIATRRPGRDARSAAQCRCAVSCAAASQGSRQAARTFVARTQARMC